jgi:HEAT repeat protein
MRDDLIERSTALVAEFEFPEPEFEFTVGLANSHLDLLDGTFVEEGHPGLLLKAAWARGRVLLHGEGGAGKTTVARRLMASLSDEGRFVALVDLRDWDPDMLSAWEELLGEPAARADLLLECLSKPEFGEGDLALLGPEAPALLVLDGLNETPGPTANSILEVADGIAARNPHVGVLVTDRLLRRTLPNRHWQLAGIIDVLLPGGTAVPGQLSRGNAFFLDLAIEDAPSEAEEGLSETTPATAILDKYLVLHVGLNGVELSQASTAAADAYLQSSSRVFELERFESIAGEKAVEALMGAGLLKGDDGHAIFRHHLFHDDLAARWLAEGGDDRWNAENFAALTFEANSFDALALALTRVGDADGADHFVLSVYDYNYYGTAYALAEGDRLGDTAVGRDTRLAIISMLAERRFDRMVPTVAQVEDALRLFDDETTADLRQADTLDRLLELVAGIEIEDPLIRRWQALFIAAPGSRAPGDAVEHLVGDNPLLGWTAANVLRRTKMDDKQMVAVWAAMREDVRPVVRWRAAHALGNQPIEESVARLLDATHDENALVRYGAVRSLVDLAAAHEGLREEILSALEGEAARLVADPKPALELERSLQRVDSTPEWIADVAPLVQELWAKAPSIERREHWRVVARRIGNPSPMDAGSATTTAA